METRLVRNESRGTETPSTEERELEVEGRELSDLNGDLLEEVFSYLPRVELFEVMSVSKHWKNATMEGCNLWKAVDVLRKCDFKGETVRRVVGYEVNEMLARIIRAAEKVRFSSAFRNDLKCIAREGGLLGPQLRMLELPDDSPDATCLQLILGNCLQLQSLVIKGEPCGDGPIHISHPKLEILEIRCRESRPLDVNCPNLTNLSTGGDDNESRVHLDRPLSVLSPLSFFCPRLSNLRLSPRHCATGLLESMAAHAPYIKRLQAECSARSPFDAFIHFRCLQVLKFDDCIGIPPADFSQWLLLESLVLKGDGFAERLVVGHQRLTSLEIIDWEGLTSPTLTCFSLEELKLQGNVIGEDCVQNINVTCPKLRRLVLEWGSQAEEGQLKIFHEALEELEVSNLCHERVQIDCRNVKTLVLRSSEFSRFLEERTLPPLTLECPNVTMLRISGYTDAHRFPWLLSSFPSLKALEVLRGADIWGDVMLEHPHVNKVVMRGWGMEKLVLLMPSLTSVKIVWGFVQQLQVAPREDLTLEVSKSGKGDWWKGIIPGGKGWMVSFGEQMDSADWREV